MKYIPTFESFLNEGKDEPLQLGDLVTITDKKYANSAKVTKGTIVEIAPGGMITIETTRGKKQLHPSMVELQHRPY